MPAYLSHAIMADQVYQIGFREDFFKSFVDYENIKTFSLGTDLAYYSKKSCYLSHNYRTQDFFLCMLKYIKENKLQDDSKVMAFLYGHISHYFLDVYCHPFVYYMERGLIHSTRISNHVLMEGFLSSYLCSYVLHKNFMEVKSSYFNQGDLSYIENKKMLQHLYQTVYDDPYILVSANGVLKTFSMLENFSKSGAFSKNTLRKYSGFDKFLEKNYISTLTLLNFSNKKWRNPVTGEIHYESINDLYRLAVFDTINAIDEINGYLYGIRCLDDMKTVFADLSYDTGVDCSLGNQMFYVRKR